MRRLASGMASYLRMTPPGGTWFFTVRLADRSSDLLVREIDLLRRCVRHCRARHPFDIDEMVVLPNAIHAIWTLPAGDGDFSVRWQTLKSAFSRALPTPARRDPVAERRGEKGIWQRRFWEHCLRDAEDLDAHRHLVWTAPVQAGLVNRPQDWGPSSVHRAIAQGRVPRDLPVGFGYLPYRNRAANG